jgi:hypothetical protein
MNKTFRKSLIKDTYLITDQYFTDIFRLAFRSNSNFYHFSIKPLIPIIDLKYLGKINNELILTFNY